MAGFPKGSRLDDLNDNRTPGSYGRARNMILNKDAIMETENGYIIDYEFDMPLIGTIPFPNGYGAFTGNDIISEIGVVINGIYTVVLRNTNGGTGSLNFNILNPIKGVFTFNRDGNLIFVWTDAVIDLRMLNVTVPQFTHGLTTDKYLNIASDIELINLFTTTSKLNVNVLDVVDNGGSLSAGSYQIAIAYGFVDGTITPSNELSNCIPIFRPESTLPFDQIDGGVLDESTSKAIRISIDELNTIYDGVFVYVRYRGTTTNEIVVRSPMFTTVADGSSITVEIDDIRDWDLVSIKDVTISSAIYTTCEDIAVVDNQLLLAGPTGVSNHDIKSIAAGVTTKWVYDTPVALDRYDTSHKDSVMVYANKSFRPGDVYALYLTAKLKKGGYLPLEHIPGRTARFAETYPYVDGSYENTIATGVQKYQIEDTCSTDVSANKGLMSYWENKDEVYADDVALTGNVRHHKFPSLNYLQDKFLQGSAAAVANTQYNISYAKMGPDDSNIVLYGMYLDFSNNGNVISNDGVVIVNHDPVTGETGRHTKFTSIATHAIRVALDIKLHVIVDVPSVDIDGNPITDAHIKVVFEIHKLNSSGTEVAASPTNIDNTTPYDITGNADITFSNIWNTSALTLATGESIMVTAYIHNNDSGHKEYIKTSCDVSFGNSSILLGLTEPVGMTNPMQGRILGLEVSNVIIPDELKPLIEGWEIFYAERGMNDMTRISQSILVDNLYAGSPTIPTKYCNFHGFDLQVSGINVNPTHTETQYAILPTAINNSSRINNITRNLQLATTLPNVNKVIDVRYVPANFTSDDVTINNRYKEAALRLKFDKIFDGTNYNVVDLCAVKNNVFFDYHNQKPVSTGKLFSVDTTTAVITSGDTFLSMYTIHLFKPDDTGVIKTINNVKSTVYDGRMPYTITIPVYSSYNIGLRSEGSLATEKLYPKTPKVLTTEFPNRDIYFGYNQVYTGLNNVTNVIIRPRFNVFTNLFPNRLHLSLKPSDEALVLNWRTFLAGDYKTIPFNKGKIIGVQVQGNQVIIACEYSTFKIGIKDMLTTDGFDAYLKRGELFDRPVEELVKTNDGYIGSLHKFGMTTNELGTFIIDSVKRKIYIVSSDLKEITKEGYINYFNGALTFATSETDSPFFLEGITTAIDRVNERIFFLIRHTDRPTQVVSYSFIHNCWSSEHEYINDYGNPVAIFSNRNGTYIIYSVVASDHSGTSKVINVGIRKSNGNIPQPSSYVETIITDNNATKKLYESLIWDTTIKENVIQDETFDEVIIHAGSQGANVILDAEVTSRKDFTTGNLQHIKGVWVLGDLNDRVGTKDITIFADGITFREDCLEGYVLIDLIAHRNTYYKVVNKNIGGTVNCVYNGKTYTEDMTFKTDDTHDALTSIGSGANIVLTKPKGTTSKIVNSHLIACFIYNGTKKLYISDVSSKSINTI